MSPVTIVLPTRNEAAHIADCLDTLLAQDHPDIVEILVVDGRSSDRTREIARSRGSRVRVVDNPGLTAAEAMNLGLAEAGTDLIVRADAHTLYAPDYVSRSVKALQDSGADWIGGPMRPVGRTPFGRAVARVTSSPLGIGPGLFHYADRAADVDTVYLGTFRKATVVDAGGYDTEHLQWAAEDQELAFRLRLRGHRVRVDPSIRSQYFPRQHPRQLWRQYRNYGVCKASTLAKHRTLPTWRPLAPAALVAGSAAALVLGAATRRPLVGVLPAAVYGSFVGWASRRLTDEPGVERRHVAAAIAICHTSYGLGFWSGIGRIVRRRPFDTRPGAR